MKNEKISPYIDFGGKWVTAKKVVKGIAAFTFLLLLASIIAIFVRIKANRLNFLGRLLLAVLISELLHALSKCWDFFRKEEALQFLSGLLAMISDYTTLANGTVIAYKLYTTVSNKESRLFKNKKARMITLIVTQVITFSLSFILYFVNYFKIEERTAESIYDKWLNCKMGLAVYSSYYAICIVNIIIVSITANMYNKSYKEVMDNVKKSPEDETKGENINENIEEDIKGSKNLLKRLLSYPITNICLWCFIGIYRMIEYIYLIGKTDIKEKGKEKININDVKNPLKNTLKAFFGIHMIFTSIRGIVYLILHYFYQKKLIDTEILNPIKDWFCKNKVIEDVSLGIGDNRLVNEDNDNDNESESDNN